MRKINCLQLILLVSAFTASRVSSDTARCDEGALCISSDGSAGVCRKLSECPAAQDDIRYTDSIVCCSKTRGVQSMKIVCAGSNVNNSVTSRPKRYGGVFRTIIGGSNVIAREFPHMAALGYVKKQRVVWLCGGTLIHKRFVLTAAHCLEEPLMYGYGKVRHVRLGDVDLKGSADDVDVQMLNVWRQIVHPDYRFPEKYHDIGLLQLNRDVTFDISVKPACLHTSDIVPDDTPVATGWGLTEPGRNSRGEKKLLKVELDFHPMKTCNDSMTRQKKPSELQRVLSFGLLDDSMLCVGALEGGRDTCQGDSGGPLQVRVRSPMCDFDVVGVTSFGLDCAKPNTPAVYTRVSKYVPWIESVVCSYRDGS